MTKNLVKFALAGTLAFGLSMPLASVIRADHDWGRDCHDRLQADRDRIDREAARECARARQVDAPGIDLVPRCSALSTEWSVTANGVATTRRTGIIMRSMSAFTSDTIMTTTRARL
jgi:hypothetical protein